MVVGAIRGAAPDREPLLVGAMARDILLAYAHGIVLERATSDIDFAFAVEAWEAFEDLRGRLIAIGFDEARGVRHRLLFRGIIRVDILPFGGVEDGRHQISWPPERAEVMNVAGYAQASRDAVEVLLPGGEQIRVVSLPALAMLKLFAWQDRRHQEPRGKDAVDLWSILVNYVDAGNQDRLYGEFAYLHDLPGFDYPRAGAWMLGLDMRNLLRADETRVLHELIGLVAREANPNSTLDLVRDTRQRNLDFALLMLQSMKQGLEGLGAF